jgi:anion transporter
MAGLVAERPTAPALPREGLWTRIDARRAEASERSEKAKRPARRLRWIVDAIVPLTLTLIVGTLVLLPSSLPGPARAAIFAFSLAAILWSTTSLNAAYVALAAVMLLILTGGGSQELLFDALASDVVWLMIGAFVLGGAVQQTGLAARLTRFVVGRARTIRGLFWLMTTALIPLTFFIPSTSGRAAIVVPVFRSIAAEANDRRITRALALLMPTVILVATISTLVGAGSHLIANDLLHQIAGRRISFLQWILYGLPFGIVASYASCWVVCRLFLDRGRLDRALPTTEARAAEFSRPERITLGVVALMVSLWLSEGWHGLDVATVTVLGALALTAPRAGVMKWKAGLKAVEWNLVIFVGAALVLGRALIDSGAAQWIIERLFAASGIAGAESRALVLVLLSGIALTSHLYMTSHTARAAALVPPLLYLGSSLGLNPVAVMFIGTVGMDFCLTFPVSSKALLMFQELDEETYQPADLLRLSAVLLVVHLVLMVAFYYAYWRWVGLEL